MCGFTHFAASTHDQEVFSFHPDERFCHGFEEVLERYRELVPQLKLAGILNIVQTSFPFFLYFIHLFAYAIFAPNSWQDQHHLPQSLRWQSP